MYKGPIVILELNLLIRAMIYKKKLEIADRDVFYDNINVTETMPSPMNNGTYRICLQTPFDPFMRSYLLGQ